MTQSPQIPVLPVPAQGGYSPSEPFPAVRPISEQDLVGPEDTNERLNALAKRDRAVVQVANNLVGVVNYMLGKRVNPNGESVNITPDGKPRFLARDGSNYWLGNGNTSPTNPSAGHLYMSPNPFDATPTRYMIRQAGDAVDPYDLVNLKTCIQVVLSQVVGSSLDTSLFIQKTGAVTWAGPLDLDMSPNGGTTRFKIINGKRGVAPNDFTTLEQVQEIAAAGGLVYRTGTLFDGGVVSLYQDYPNPTAIAFKRKDAVRTTSTTNLTLSGLQTVSGVSLSAGNRVLVRAQSAPANNGIYVVSSGAWTRATDMDSSGGGWSAKVPRAFTYATEGSQAGIQYYVNATTTSGTFGVTPMAWTLISLGPRKPHPSDFDAPAVSYSDYICSSSAGDAVSVVSGVPAGTWRFIFWGDVMPSQNVVTVVRLHVNGQTSSARVFENALYNSARYPSAWSDEVTVTVPGVGTYAGTFTARLSWGRNGAPASPPNPALACFRGLHFIAIKVG